MARGDTFNKNKKPNPTPVFESMLEFAPDEEEELNISVKDEEVEAIKNVFGGEAVQQLPTRTVKPLQPKVKAKSKSTVTRTLRIDADVSKALNSTVSDGNGKKVAGSKGFMGDVVNNALIKELVLMGALNKKYLENIKPYD